jgi:3-hydroxyacyl-CoA dehydrogenase
MSDQVQLTKNDEVSGSSPVPPRCAAVVGAGTMGGGIAMVFANAGIPVLLKETEPAALDRGLATIQSNYVKSVQRGRFTQEVGDERFKRITPTLSYDGFAEVDLVIEAAFENLALKKEIFQQLDRVCRSGAILASNTSSLSIDEIASATSRPEFVIGLHFFSPANVMRLLEIVRGQATSNEVIATCVRLAKTLGKVGVVVGNCRGFVGNRMFHPYRREAQFLVEEGAAIETVDKTLTDFGMAMGPLATGDLAGLDVGWRIRKEYRHLQKPGVRQPFAEDKLCELGRFGQKTGAGWYKYDEARRPSLDPAVTQQIGQWVAESGIPQRAISAQEILDRCIYALVNEAAHILQEGIAQRASDIDIIYLNGYGFPAALGGPMSYADTVGLGKVYDRITEFHRVHGETWQPAPLLKQLARQGKTLADFGQEKGEVAVR